MERLAEIASRTLYINRECLVAKWILDNPNRSIDECKIIQQNSGSKIEFYIETTKILRPNPEFTIGHELELE